MGIRHNACIFLPTHCSMPTDLPNIIEPLDYETILARRQEAFIALWPVEEQASWRDTIALESEPVTKLLQESAYLELLLRSRINHAARANLLLYAAERDLDRLADFYGLLRFEGETDEAFRVRIQARTRASATAGAAAHYRYHALSAHPAVLDVNITSPKPGLVRVYVRPKPGHISEAVSASVSQKLQADDVRVLTDTVEVLPAQRLPILVHAKITLLPDAPYHDLSLFEDDLKQAFSSLGLGRDVTLSWLLAKLQRPHVYRVELLSPVRDVFVLDHQYAALDGLTLELVGRAY